MKTFLSKVILMIISLGIANLPIQVLAKDSLSCDYGARHESTPKEFEQFEFLLGSYRASLSFWDAELKTWKKVFDNALWEGEYILDGKAIADYWYQESPEANPNTGVGVNIRIYNPEGKYWVITWVGSDDFQAFESRAEIRDGTLWMWDIHPKFEEEAVQEFVVESKTRWFRNSYKIINGEKIPTLKIEANLIQCEDD